MPILQRLTPSNRNLPNPPDNVRISHSRAGRTFDALSETFSSTELPSLIQIVALQPHSDTPGSPPCA